jgi:hypothetical protein
LRGGVGHFAIQIAKSKQAHVAITVSAQHIEFVRQLGADQVVDYQTQRFEDVIHEVDVVFDLIRHGRQVSVAGQGPGSKQPQPRRGTLRQEELGNPNFGCDLSPIDFAAYAKACGAAGFHCTTPDESGAAYYYRDGCANA